MCLFVRPQCAYFRVRVCLCEPAVRLFVCAGACLLQCAYLCVRVFLLGARALFCNGNIAKMHTHRSRCAFYPTVRIVSISQAYQKQPKRAILHSELHLQLVALLNCLGSQENWPPRLYY